MIEIEKEQLVVLAKSYFDNPTDPQSVEAVIRLCEHLGLADMARQERRNVVNAFIARQEFGEAFLYGSEHRVLIPGEECELAFKHCHRLLNLRPWDALTIAREYGFADLALKAARMYGEQIMFTPGHDVGPLMDISRRELAADREFCKRAARTAYQTCLRLCKFSELYDLAVEFQEFFSEDETVLAHELMLACEKARQATVASS